MSIAPLYKVTMCGAARQKSWAIEALQMLGVVHLVSLKPKPAVPQVVPPTRIGKLQEALRYLGDTPDPRPPLLHSTEENVDSIVTAILINRQALCDIEDQLDTTRHHIAALAPWGDFTFPPLEQMGGYATWFYVVPQHKCRLLPTHILWQEITRCGSYAYIVALARSEPAPEDFPVPRSHIGSVPLHQLEARLEALEVLREDVRDERHRLTQYRTQLYAHLAAFSDGSDRDAALQNCYEENGFFLLQGWVAVADAESLQEFSAGHGLGLLLEPPTAEDTPPTLLNNREVIQAGESLTNLYQTPGYLTLDPSLAVFVSFALFFAMILSDAGYAALLSLIALWKWRDAERRWRPLLCILCLFSLAYGVLAGSYFGLSPSADSLPGMLRVLDTQDVDFMMQFSIFVGCLHVILANLMIAVHTSQPSQRRSAMGYVCFVVAGIIRWQWEEVYYPVAYALAGIGGAVLLFGAGNQPVRDTRSLFRRIVAGAVALTALTKLFGDIMSYMRLFALGTAGAALAATFNGMAAQLYHDMPIAGVALAPLVLLVGHALNFALSLMGGVVHGLRLNFIEFFGWAIPEEGTAFTAFRRKESVYE